MEQSTVTIVLTIAGALILILITCLGFFISMFIGDVKANAKDISKLHGMLESSNQKYNGEIKLLAERTELQIQQVNKNVDTLYKTVQILVSEKLAHSKD